jgi:signal transduction histidine kinase
MFKKLNLLFVTFLLFFKLHAERVFTEDSLYVTNQFTALVSQDSVYSNTTYLVHQFTPPSSKNSAELKSFILFNVAKYLYAKGQLDATLEFINGSELSESSRFLPKIINLKGIVLTLKKNNYDAVNAYLYAAELYKKKNEKILEHIVYNNIANLYLSLGDYEQAYKHSRKCFDVVQLYPENKNYYTMLGVLTICEINLNNFKDAKKHIEMLEPSKTGNNPLAKVLTFYAESEYYLGIQNFKKAIEQAQVCIAISEKYNLVQYIQLGNIILMKSYNELNDYKKAIVHGKLANELIKTTQNSTIISSISKGLAIAYAEIDQFEKAFFYQNISDSIRSKERAKENRSKIDSLLLHFESIASKNKILSQENEIVKQKKEITQGNNLIQLIIIVAGFGIIITFIIILFYKQRLNNLRNKHEKRILHALNVGEEKERKRIAEELHDGLASELTALKMVLEQTTLPQKEQVLNQLTSAHQSVRRISHNLSPLQLKRKGLVSALNQFIESLDLKINITFYTNVSQKLNIPRDEALILFRCSQEIIQNALKHSQSKTIDVQLLKAKDKITISIEDDGVGFNLRNVDNKHGIDSIKDRLSSISGSFILESKPKQGTTVFISIPYRL